MPTVSVNRRHLVVNLLKLGEDYTDEQFENLCFRYGIELDDVTTEREVNTKQGQSVNQSNSQADEIIYKIEVPANRYDLLCIEGLALNLQVFLGQRESLPKYTINQSVQPVVIKQTAATKSVRPFIVGAVLRGVTFTPSNYQSFIDLQDKLHQNIGRRRTLVAIGTHDLSTLTGPFVYDALPQSDISFKPLNEQQSFKVNDLFDYYRSKHSHLAPYLSITADSPVHPVIFDANKTVLSLPPIINGDHSKITLATRDVLIECTGTDETKLNVVLNTVIAMFSQYCEKPFTCEAVTIVDVDGKQSSTPVFDSPVFTVPVATINRTVGVSLAGQEMVDLLRKMSLEARCEGEVLHVTTPITRSDILHACDIIEDVAIGYGYDNIVRTIPSTYTPGRQLSINQCTDQLRDVVAQAGWMEVLTWALVSTHDSYDAMLLSDPNNAIKVSQPKTAEFEQVRVSLLPGLLRALASNKGQIALPVRLFEAGDIAMQADDTDTGANNTRHLAALYCGSTSGFEAIHGLVDRIMKQNRFVFKQDLNDTNNQANKHMIYELHPCDHPSYLSKRHAEIHVNGQVIGRFGVLHPKVLSNFDIDFPCSVVELNVQLAFGDERGVGVEQESDKQGEHPIVDGKQGQGKVIIH